MRLGAGAGALALAGLVALLAWWWWPIGRPPGAAPVAQGSSGPVDAGQAPGAADGVPTRPAGAAEAVAAPTAPAASAQTLATATGAAPGQGPSAPTSPPGNASLEAARSLAEHAATGVDPLIATPGRQTAAAVAAQQPQPQPPNLARAARRKVADDDQPSAAPTVVDAGLPAYPGATQLADQSLRLRDGDTETVTVVLSASAPLERVSAFYRERLAQPASATQRVQAQADGQSWRLADPAQRQLQSVRLVTVGAATVIELTNTRWH